jgi:N-acetylneuraminate synthase
MSSTYIIAEAGVNHNGDIGLAKQLVDYAKSAGADAVKFQLFQAEKLVTAGAEQAEYQRMSTAGAKTQYEMLKALELSNDMFIDLQSYAKKNEIDFLVTPFDLDALVFINETLALPKIKIGSGDITNGPLLLKTGQFNKPVILSTGMSTLAEIELALNVIAYGMINTEKQDCTQLEDFSLDSEIYNTLKNKVILLHCTSEYPAPYNEINLKAMDTLRFAFGLPVGLSDHSMGIEIPLAAVARGAECIEKHFTIDKTLPGPDHKASLCPSELQSMVTGIRNIEQALGDGHKRPTSSELKNRALVRRSIVADQNIQAGELFTVTNLAVKRPYSGSSPMKYWDILGTRAEKDYSKDEAIT